MVVDTLENLEKYASLNPLFAQAIEFLKSHDLQAMEIGKTELKGKDLLVNIAQTKPKTKEEAKLETHNEFIDMCACRRSLQCRKRYYFLRRTGRNICSRETGNVCHLLPARRTCSRHYS